MIANPLKILGNHEKITCLLSVVRILMYQCDELILDLVKEVIDDIIVLYYTLCFLLVCIDIGLYT